MEERQLDYSKMQPNANKETSTAQSQSQKAPDKQEISKDVYAQNYLWKYLMVSKYAGKELQTYLGVNKTHPEEILRELLLSEEAGVPISESLSVINNGPGALRVLRQRYLWTAEVLERFQQLEERLHSLENTVPRKKLFTKDKSSIAKKEKKKKSKKPEKPAKMKTSAEQRRDFLSQLAENYDEQQMSFVADCLEEGMSQKEIQSFLSPNLPVELLLRLKEMKLQMKGEKPWKFFTRNKKMTQEEATD